MDNKNASLYRIILGYGKTAGNLRLANQSGVIPVLPRFLNYGQVIKLHIANYIRHSLWLGICFPGDILSCVHNVIPMLGLLYLGILSFDSALERPRSNFCIHSIIRVLAALNLLRFFMLKDFGMSSKVDGISSQVFFQFFSRLYALNN